MALQGQPAPLSMDHFSLGVPCRVVVVATGLLLLFFPYRNVGPYAAVGLSLTHFINNLQTRGI